MFRMRLQLVAALVGVSLYISAVSYFQLSGRDTGGTGQDIQEALRQSHDVFPGESNTAAAQSNFYDPYFHLKLPHLVHKHYVKTCQEKTNFVFIKCMKCATETMGTILRRYGYIRNLSFVVPNDKLLYLGWPYPMTHKDYRPSKTGGFNILVEHSIYTKTVMRQIMPTDTKYVTIIREPYNHFKSVFNYFNIANVAKIPGPDTLTEYLHNIEKYDAFYKSQEASPIRYCIPNNFSMTQNLLSRCLGMPLGFPPGHPDISSDTMAIQSYIKQLDDEFSLVMILEYFMESLVMLRRLMCWTIKDILYHSVNRQDYRYKRSFPKPGNLEIYHRWSHIDFMLYDHFNKTFWKKVEEQDDNFRDEVYFLFQVETQMEIYCFGSNRTVERPPLQIPASPWGQAFNFTAEEDCKLLRTNLFEKIKEQYDQM